jgi:hypothetical protein
MEWEGSGVAGRRGLELAYLGNANSGKATRITFPTTGSAANLIHSRAEVIFE